MVIFFPSYAYLNAVVHQWQKTQSTITNARNATIWDHLCSTKEVFLEPGAVSQQTLKASHTSSNSPSQTTNTHAKQSAETVLSAYATHIKNNSPRGAILFAVISGSLSEGINFSDALGRLIAVVGLPFPNPSSSTWQAKMEFVKQRALRDASVAASTSSSIDLQRASAKTTQASVESSKMAQAAAQQHTLATTMRAVNQSIGRAIRHKDDWAAILLLDKRYGRKDVLEQLPPWIARSMLPTGEGVAGTSAGGRCWGEVTYGLRDFY